MIHFDNSWALTVPSAELPQLKLPFFSDPVTDLSEYTIEYGLGAQHLANYALAFAAEAMIMQGREVEEVHLALASGQLTVKLAVTENPPEAPDAATEIRVVPSESMRTEDADWSCELTLADSKVDVSSVYRHTVRTRATFRQSGGPGMYVPERLWYTKSTPGRPYIAVEHGTVFAGLCSYTDLMDDGVFRSHSTAQQHIEPLRLMGVARERMSRLLSPPVMASARIAVQTSVAR